MAIYTRVRCRTCWAQKKENYSLLVAAAQHIFPIPFNVPTALAFNKVLQLHHLEDLLQHVVVNVT